MSHSPTLNQGELPTPDALPAYYASWMPTIHIPFMVTLLFLDEQRQPRLVPTAQRCLDRCVEITGRSGILVAVVAETDNLRQLVQRRFAQAALRPDGIVGFLCQTDEVAEKLMRHINEAFPLTLMKAQSQLR